MQLELHILVDGFMREKFCRNTLCSEEEKGTWRKTLQRRREENLIAHLITFPLQTFSFKTAALMRNTQSAETPKRLKVKRLCKLLQVAKYVILKLPILKH